MAFVRQENSATVGVDVVGLSGAGHWVATARAIAGRAIDRAAIDTAGFRFGRLTAIDEPDFLPGGAKYGDLPGMIALSAPIRSGWPGRRCSVSPISAAYRAAGHATNLAVLQEKDQEPESAAVQWLLKDAHGLPMVSGNPTSAGR